ncbi:MAG: sigma-70 family RNA polymerase sigma factor [Deltaproteobacteria bacterium]|nr:sigma-70 family RNA polymerase sigma factor [Deltaproteobacteria bacterium]
MLADRAPSHDGKVIERDTLTDLYERLGPVVYRRALSLLHDPDEARDAMQAVFVRVIEQHESFRGEAPVLQWIYRITTNLCLNRLRQRRAHPIVTDPNAVLAIVAGERDSVDRSTVVALLSRVDLTTQKIAVHYYVDEMSMEEVAELVGLSRKTVGKKLESFRKRAQALLADLNPAESDG